MTGYKTYNDGEVLVADDLNDYLQQGVLRYATKAARDADLTTNAREGMVAYSTSDNTVSWYDGSGWNDLVQTAIPRAQISTTETGTATIDGFNYKYWTFTSSGSLVVSSAGFVDVLVVGGGGGSGNTFGAGAGGVNFRGGGIDYEQGVYVTAGTIPVVVGAGGAGILAFDANGFPYPAYNGHSSAFGSQVVAVGGGGAGNFGNTGGSGAAFRGSGTTSQGNDGGGSLGGGGGAGAAGQDGNSTTGDGGDGGDGLQYNMNGTPTYYGGGGGGGANADIGGTKGIGGLGGGGDGSDTATSGQAGSANTGGGAGGGAALVGGFGYYGNNGGSGIVIIRVLTV